MLTMAIAGSALIVGLVALYYVNRAIQNIQVIFTVLVNTGLIEIQYVDEEEDE